MDVLGVLQSILCVLQNILLAILWAGAKVVQLLIDAIVLAVGAALSVLPSMPDVPAIPNPGNWRGAFNYFFPMATFMVAATAILAGYLTWIGVRALLIRAGVIG